MLFVFTFTLGKSSLEMLGRFGGSTSSSQAPTGSTQGPEDAAQKPWGDRNQIWAGTTTKGGGTDLQQKDQIWPLFFFFSLSSSLLLLPSTAVTHTWLWCSRVPAHYPLLAFISSTCLSKKSNSWCGQRPVLLSSLEFPWAQEQPG